MSAKKKSWPQECVWPEPTEYGYWEPEDAEGLELDEFGEDLLEIKEYMDELVSEGRLNPDYTLNEEYEDFDNEDEQDEPDDDDEEEFVPEKGEEYWDDGFIIEAWEEDIIEHLNRLKIPLSSPVDDIQRIIGYEFINENLIRQAFTRRAFSLEYGCGNSEVLEFIGDAVLNTIVTREMARQTTEMGGLDPSTPFTSTYGEGELTRIKQHYVSKDFLSERAVTLGLDQYILYGSNEEPNESAREDMMEALIGAVAADSDWNWHELETVVDRLICFQLSNPGRYARETYYELFNAWHQKRFGRMPEYEVSRGVPVGKGSKEYEYTCTLRFFIPENDKGIWTDQRIDVQRGTRSRAREWAAEVAYRFVVDKGLWMNLSDAGIEPKKEDAINQLQELYQKKYVNQPQYYFEEESQGWHCRCFCDGVEGFGSARNKTAAKKKAAYMVLVRLMISAGICKDEWEKEMWR